MRTGKRQPVQDVRRRAGRARREQTVASPADQTVNHSTRWVARPAEDVEHGAGVEVAVDHEAAADHPADRQHEEDGEHQHRRPAAEAGESRGSRRIGRHWLVTSLQSRSHSSRCAAISAGSTA